MRTNRYILPALLAGVSAGMLVSCDDDKQLTLDAPQVKLIEEVTFDLTPELPLPVGMDTVITYTFGPETADDQTIVFTSTDETIASVDQEGRITAHREGEATITARPPFDYKVYDAEATVLVKVIPELIKVEKINLTNTTPSEDGKIYVTDELVIAAEILPADHTYSRLVWHSSNDAIATVDNEGNVVCLSEGDVTIYATATDRTGTTGEIKLHVDKYIAAEKLTITPLDGPVSLYNGEIRLGVTYEPTGATVGSVDWSSDNEEVATVRRGVVTPVGFGTANIIATCAENGFQTSVQITVDPGWIVWDSANQWTRWEVSNYNTQILSDSKGDHTWHLIFKNPGEGKKWRGDIRVNCSDKNPLPMSLKNYPVFAVRTSKINGGNSTLDMVEITLGGGGNPNPKNGIDLGDGTQLLIYNIGAKYKDADKVSFKTFQIKIADIPYENVDPSSPFYEVYWMRTFKSEDAAKAFAAEEVAAGK